jgi:hypothetical protein
LETTIEYLLEKELISLAYAGAGLGGGFFGTSTAVILVLFILIAIVGRSGGFGGVGV